MNKETLAALNGSIRKWKKIVEGTEVDRGTDNCPLCQMFHRRRIAFQRDSACDGCPVKNKSGEMYCESTPYIEWGNHHAIKHGSASTIIKNCPTCKELAQKELDFLRSLLPKGEENEQAPNV